MKKASVIICAALLSSLFVFTVCGCDSDNDSDSGYSSTYSKSDVKKEKTNSDYMQEAIEWMNSNW